MAKVKAMSVQKCEFGLAVLYWVLVLVWFIVTVVCVGTHVTEPVWRSEDKSEQSVLFFYLCVGSRD
jgi:amino acid permease